MITLCINTQYHLEIQISPPLNKLINHISSKFTRNKGQGLFESTIVTGVENSKGNQWEVLSLFGIDERHY